MSKTLKNTTGSPIVFKSIALTIPAAGQEIITIEEYLYLGSTASLAEISPLIISGDIVINDGVDDITVANGFSLQRAIDFLKYPDEAFNIRFAAEPERNNGFVSKNVQEAIEEGKNTAIGSLLPYKFTAGGSNVSNAWLSVADPSAPSNDVPLIVPQESELKGVEFSNADDSSDTDIEVYINAVYSFTVEVRAKRYFWKVGATLATASQGDRISIFLRKIGATGNAPSKPEIILLGKIISEVADTNGEEFGD